MQAVHEAGQRIGRLKTAIGDELQHWRWRSVVAALQAFRGMQTIHAVRIVAELGDLTRFGSARRALVKAAWAYRYSARVSPMIARRQSGIERSVTDLA